MNDFRQSAVDAILEDLDFDSVKELRAYVSKNKQDDYFYGGILYAINAVQDLSSAQPVARDTNVLSNDTISRRAAIDAIDKILPTDPMKNEYTKGYIVGAALALKYVMQLPSAQSAYTNEQIQKMQDMHQAEVEKAFELGMEDAKTEIIHCKDCKYYQFADNRAFGFPVKRCKWTEFEDVDDDDFCSMGERKNE